jgi:phenylacetic acid degradation operon negative regulatory protein
MGTSVSQSVTSSRRSAQGRSVRLVPFLFGVAATVGRAELPGRVLVALLGDLGLSAPAARALIARMQRDGQLAGARRGRAVDYHLAGAFAESFHRIRTGATGAPWPGHFHALLYRVPERHRAFRDRLRRIGTFTGYGLLQQGVLISPTDRRHLLDAVLADTPAGAIIHFGQLQMERADATRAAYTAWDLGALDRTYRTHARRLRGAIARRSTTPPADGRTLRRFTNLLSGPLVDTLRATGLPADLAPSGWALPDLRAAIREVEAVYLPPATRYVRRLLDEEDTILRQVPHRAVARPRTVA